MSHLLRVGHRGASPSNSTAPAFPDQVTQHGAPRPSTATLPGGTGILNNELYIGRLVWNRLRYVKDPVTGKRVSRPNMENDWIIREVPELRIVDQGLWDRVKLRQAELRKNTRPDRSQRPFWSMVRPKYLLSGCCAAESVAAPTRRSTPTCSVVLLLGTRGLATTASTFVAMRSNPLCWMD